VAPAAPEMRPAIKNATASTAPWACKPPAAPFERRSHPLIGDRFPHSLPAAILSFGAVRETQAFGKPYEADWPPRDGPPAKKSHVALRLEGRRGDTQPRGSRLIADDALKEAQGNNREYRLPCFTVKTAIGWSCPVLIDYNDATPR
jgi:hypothetical protein